MRTVGPSAREHGFVAVGDCVSAQAEDRRRDRTSATFRDEALVHLWGHVRDGGSAWVETSYVCVDGFRLGAWVHRCRRRRGADPELDALLESLPGWTWTPIEERFRRRVRIVQEAARAGRLRGDRRLSAWLNEQKRAVRTGRLDHGRVELLRQAGLIPCAPASALAQKDVHPGAPADVTCSGSGPRE